MTGTLRILVVDDSAAVRAVLQGLLTSLDCKVRTADGVRAALRRLRDFNPDVILTDFTMPGLNGDAFVRLLRRDSRFIDTPVFVVSSEEAPEKRRAMEEAGANAWFSKPIQPHDLVCAVLGVARAARLRRSAASPAAIDHALLAQL
jgi:CheY-like chemotaxis protein